jgi:hypothetical protein
VFWLVICDNNYTWTWLKPKIIGYLTGDPCGNSEHRGIVLFCLFQYADRCQGDGERKLYHISTSLGSLLNWYISFRNFLITCYSFCSAQLANWHLWFTVFISLCKLLQNIFTERRLFKQRPFLGNDSITRSFGNEYAGNNRFTFGNGMFLCGPCEDRAWARKAEESLLLEAVAREGLVKTAGWKKRSGYCGDLWIVEISSGAVIPCTYESCV